MYDIIKKQNGERFAKSIRNYDNGIFDIPNIDKIVKYAGREAEPIMQYLISLRGVKVEEQGVHQDPIALLNKAGYDAYIADTLEKQNAIKKYYVSGEELCTFRDPFRFKKYYIINAVRKDVNKIKRSDFKNPQREDEYGTSVLSIQVLKSGGFISIKNRYNHTVQNPDNTLNSNPDNIIMGLSDAIKHHFNVDFSAQRVELPDNYILINNQIVKYNCEINNMYFGSDYYVKDGVVIELDKSSQLMLGRGFIYDNKSKKILDYKSLTTNISTQFIDNDFLNNKNIKIAKNRDGSHSLVVDGTVFLSVQDGEMFYINPLEAKNLNLTDFKLRGELDFSDVEKLDLCGADLSAASSLILPKKPKLISLQGVIFPATTVDFSSIKKLNLCDADLSRITKIILPHDAESIECLHEGLPENAPEIDFSGTKKLTLYGIPNIDKIQNIKFPKNADVVSLTFFSKIPNLGVMDFSGVKQLDLSLCDLSKTKRLILPKNAEYIYLNTTKLPKCDVDFSNVQCLDLTNADLSNVGTFTMCNVVFKKRYVAGMCCGGEEKRVVDFTGVKHLDLRGSDLTSVNDLVFPKKAEYINLQGAILPACDLDLSNVKEFNLYGADLSRVRSIKFPFKYKAQQGIKKVIEKIKTKVVKNAKNQNESDGR